MYFPEKATAAVYATAPYATHGPKDTSHAQGGIAGAGAPPLLTMTCDATGYVATLTITVAE